MAGDKPVTIAETPAWAIALVCFVILVLSLLLEHGIHLLHHYLSKRRRKTLILALHNLQAEIRSFGFMSLGLSMAEQPVADICISTDVADSFLPCKLDANEFLKQYDNDQKCPAERSVSFISVKGMDQLLLLIFVLAVARVVSCAITYIFALSKISKWEDWEEETRTLEYQLSHDPRRLILASETPFARRHMKGWTSNIFTNWIGSFLRLIFHPVSKADYLALRHSFIAGNFEDDYNFDFHKFIKRSLDHDFAAVTGNSHLSWLYGIVFIFLSAQRFRSYLYLPFIPLLMAVIVGTKLEVAVTKMCVDSSKEKELVPGTLCVRRSRKYFWFGKERWLLHLLNFVIFQNSFQVAFFIWTWLNFGFPSCFHKLGEDVILGIVIGVAIQILAAYVTLPLYVLVSQMDSKMKKAIFTDLVIHGLKNWKETARKNLAAERLYPMTPMDSVRSGRPDVVAHGLKHWIENARKSLAHDGDRVAPVVMTPPDSVRSSNRGSMYSDAHGDKNTEADDQLKNTEVFDTLGEMRSRSIPATAPETITKTTTTTMTAPTTKEEVNDNAANVSFQTWTQSTSTTIVEDEDITATIETNDVPPDVAEIVRQQEKPEHRPSTNVEDTITEMETRAIPKVKDKRAYDGEASFGTWHDDEVLQIGSPIGPPK